MTESNVGANDAAATSPHPTTPEPKPRTAWMKNTILIFFVLLVSFWALRPDYRPFLPWLNAPVKPFLRQTGDKQALVVGCFNNAAAVYGVRVTLSRPGQPNQRFALEKVEPGYLYAVTATTDATGRTQPVYVQHGDTVTVEANTYWEKLVYRFDQLEPEVRLPTPKGQ